MKTLMRLAGLVLAAALAALFFLYSGLYPMGADVPHNAATYWALETLRERSIARASADLQVPPLDDPAMLMSGGTDYNDMCAGCHLKPGKRDSDLSIGLYPRPPNLSQPAQQHTLPGDLAAARQFWIIKHGIKASAMPAWGPTHDDARIWAMVAFLQRLPTLTPDQYQILTAREDGETMDHASMDAAQPPAESPPAELAEADPTAIAERFRQALAAGDTDAAVVLLDPDVQIFEQGNVERSRAEYAAHHLKSDASFLKNSTLALLSRSGNAVGDLAWVGSESRISAGSTGKAVDIVSTETLVLKKTTSGWRIVHIHWSSRPSRQA